MGGDCCEKQPAFPSPLFNTIPTMRISSPHDRDALVGEDGYGTLGDYYVRSKNRN